ncbi:MULTISPECIES: HinT-interacting membrane complex lipoprotein P60 [unclassified Mycoplasma]|uniref:HinT-interacting membrane complex lipoprotein P60 n=1 Tax=unclassified Mycoplasma TaxID=2683645 RepID=UPI00211CB2EB|nr:MULTISPECIES: hypothetical protein [unclassified Mycoplasma]UUM19835.1 hypothetical protein NPA11_00110 [Mycoplasma sp. 1578d]UUM24819.1 hypothetical protein NPA12_00110 [Mycoplasma sp. 3686d]
MKRRNLLKLIFSSVILGSSTSFTVSCGATVNTEARSKQENEFKNANLEKIAEGFWLKATLSKLYSISESTLLANSTFLNQTYSAYRTYLNNLQISDPFVLYKSLTKWKNEALFNENELKILNDKSNDLFLANSTPTLEQFKVLFNKNKTDVEFNINRLLLVKKYFEISSENDLKIVNKDSYDANKEKYDLTQFNLIDYVLKTKIAQIWKYTSDTANDIFSNVSRTISNIKDYNDLLKNKKEALKVATSDLLFNNGDFEKSLGGYEGLSSSLNDYFLNTGITFLLEQNNSSNLSGFYDLTNNKLVSVDNKGQLSETIKVTNDNKKIKVTYLNVIAPIAKTVTQGVKEVKILSFDKTPYFAKFDTLKIYLAIFGGENIYKTAKKAFIDLGNKISLENDIIKDKLKGLDFIK